MAVAAVGPLRAEDKSLYSARRQPELRAMMSLRSQRSTVPSSPAHPPLAAGRSVAGLPTEYRYRRARRVFCVNSSIHLPQDTVPSVIIEASTQPSRKSRVIACGDLSQAFLQLPMQTSAFSDCRTPVITRWPQAIFQSRRRSSATRDTHPGSVGLSVLRYRFGRRVLH